jgi:hypothetical protein
LRQGASQIPRGHLGTVLIDAGWTFEPEDFARKVRRWLTEDGAEYDGLVGVLYLAREVHLSEQLSLKRVESVWRTDAPPEFTDPTIWNRLELGLNFAAFREHDWRRRNLR